MVTNAAPALAKPLSARPGSAQSLPSARRSRRTTRGAFARVRSHSQTRNTRLLGRRMH